MAYKLISITITSQRRRLSILRQRGRDLRYFSLPYSPDRVLAPFTEFLPNIRYFNAGTDACRDIKEDVIAFLNGARKLERLWIGCPDDIPHRIWEVAIARKVKLCWNEYFELPDYVELKRESWIGL
ncbi:hypothetical protein HK104_004911 [Borealophlyctis nickersoniae]|nr:hypothetical protein HK104_004911 [Borealophlyctis nickersoniae]